MWTLDDTVDKWFAVETNYDHWGPAKPSDDRRRAAVDGMRAAGQTGADADPLGVLAAVLGNDKPCAGCGRAVLNEDTVFTARICAATGHYDTLVRNKARL